MKTYVYRVTASWGYSHMGEFVRKGGVFFSDTPIDDSRVKLMTVRDEPEPKVDAGPSPVTGAGGETGATMANPEGAVVLDLDELTRTEVKDAPGLDLGLTSAVIVDAFTRAQLNEVAEKCHLSTSGNKLAVADRLVKSLTRELEDLATPDEVAGQIQAMLGSYS